ncbi:MAG: iron chaperone [Streptosporangiaceae bacterium]
MAERNTATKGTRRSAKSTDGAASGKFTDEEKAAARERVKELKRSPRASKADEERDVLEKISQMGDADRAMAERIHAIVKASAPDLTPKTWYGMPAYAKDGAIVCHFQPAQKFKTRYPTLGFSDKANLDDGTMWPVAYALTKLTKADEARIAALVKKAAG